MLTEHNLRKCKLCPVLCQVEGQRFPQNCSVPRCERCGAKFAYLLKVSKLLAGTKPKDLEEKFKPCYCETKYLIIFENVHFFPIILFPKCVNVQSGDRGACFCFNFISEQRVRFRQIGCKAGKLWFHVVKGFCKRFFC